MKAGRRLKRDARCRDGLPWHEPNQLTRLAGPPLSPSCRHSQADPFLSRIWVFLLGRLFDHFVFVEFQIARARGV
jgi:hypothetical protein